MIDHSIVVDVAGVPDAFARNVAHRVRAQRGALHVPALGAGRVPHAARVPAEPGHLPPGQPGVPRAGRVPRRRRARVSRHAGRHRLAHADGQRSRRARLGRRRHRGRGRDARPAAVAAAARGRRHRAASVRCPRARPRPTSCSPSRSCCASTASSASSSSSTARASAGSRSRTARRSATCRPSTARRARSSRSTTRRCATCARPAGPTISSRSSRPTRRNRASGTTRAARPVYDETLDARPVDRRAVARGPGAAAGSRRRSATRGDEFEKALLAFRQAAGDAHPDEPFGVKPGSADEASAESFPASDPPAAARGHDRYVGEPDGDGPPGASEPPVSVERRRCPVTLRRRHRDRDRRRSRRDRRDHVMHEHVQPVGDDRCRAARAQRGRARGLTVPPWVKTSLAPGIARRHRLLRAGRALIEPLARLGFHVVGYGCTTCIGNSGPLAPEISEAITERRPLGRVRCSRATATSRVASIPTAA